MAATFPGGSHHLSTSKPQNKDPRIKHHFFFSTDLVLPSIKPCCHIPVGSNKRSDTGMVSGMVSGQVRVLNKFKMKRQI
jgi:hypothetical protein